MFYVYRFLLPLRLVWLLVCCLYKEVYLQILDVTPFDYTTVAESGKVGPVNQVNHTNWLIVFTPTDRPKSVRNRCVIELFVDVFVLSRCPFDISVSIRAFVIGLSQISSFFSFFVLCIYLFLRGIRGVISNLRILVNTWVKVHVFVLIVRFSSDAWLSFN